MLERIFTSRKYRLFRARDYSIKVCTVSACKCKGEELSYGCRAARTGRKVDSSGEAWDFPRRRYQVQASVGHSSESFVVGNSS